MNRTKVGVMVAVLTSQWALVGAVSAQVMCDGATAYSHLYWSKDDTGHNEGADCGAAIIAKLGGYELPQAATLGALGEVFKRKEMMEIAIQIYKRGHYQEAIDIAVCSQVHNQPVHDCLRDNPAAIKDFFNNETK